MSDHLTSDDRDQIIRTIGLLSTYFCEYGTDGDLFTLHAILSQHAAQLAHRLDSMGEGMLPPSETAGGAIQPVLRESLNQRLMAAQQEAAMRHSNT